LATYYTHSGRLATLHTCSIYARAQYVCISVVATTVALVVKQAHVAT